MELRPLAADELPAFVRVAWNAFGGTASDELIDAYVAALDADRAIVAVADGSIVGTAAAYTMELTLPGGALVPVGGLTFVGVLPTHRRRGLLREMMRWHLDDCRARGEAASVLLASESRIYGRFGYGPATWAAQWELETERAAFLTPPAAHDGIALVDRDEALRLFPTVFDAVRRRRHGEVSRPDPLWDAEWRETESESSSPYFFAVHRDRAGDADGYAHYRYDDRWDDGLPRGRLDVQEVAAVAPEVEAALWRYLFDVDLVATVASRSAPLDDPLRWRLLEPRRLRTTSVTDQLWVRPLDPALLLSARRYEADGQLVVEVDGQRFTVTVEDGRATSQPTEQPAGLVLDAAALGAVVLGGVTPSRLAAAGRIGVSDAAAREAADRLLPTRTAPFSATSF